MLSTAWIGCTSGTIELGCKRCQKLGGSFLALEFVYSILKNIHSDLALLYLRFDDNKKQISGSQPYNGFYNYLAHNNKKIYTF